MRTIMLTPKNSKNQGLVLLFVEELVDSVCVSTVLPDVGGET